MSAFDFRNGRSSVGPEAMRRAATPTASMASEGYYPKPFTPLSGYGPTGSDAVVPTQNAYAETQESAYQPSYGQGYQYGYNGDLSSNQNYTDDTTAAAAPADTAAAAPPRGIQSPFQQQGPPLTTSQSAYGYFNGAGQVHQADTHGTWQSHAEQSHIDPSGQETETTTSYQPSSYEPSTTANTSFLDDEDDGLGLGNSSLRKTKPAAPSEDASKPTEDTTQADAKKEEAKKEAAPARKGWGLFSLFSRSSGDDKEEKKAVKANLGEESHFYYDEKEKRWVNKLADSQPAPAPPPPPPKAASTPTARALSPAAPPSMGQATAPPSGAGLPPPPGLARATTSPGLTNSPPTAVTPTFSTPPPSGGRRTGAGRKPMRSRYVDVFNQPPS
ncbi:uncharacterized protein BYT42DRAFT_336973 [Radiomyces spectabilis]|uniref:uncharacterized protein n=1 Tax=Radiomyces spectabilis TaxID=64574 RepID=UPI0022201CD4|nr:uncharacterized protein BYT42DRAFT_336973 [Radiomyces spectabilis]KAI8379687.1 hypothetical protein BYT42DRAFT_336973 [Radiomyces spectabilis]